MAYRSLVSVLDLPVEEEDQLLDFSDWYLPQVEEGGFKSDALKGTSALLLFYEASTRTRASFELAGKMLGSDTINVSEKGSSAEKGESVVDTALTLNAMDHNVVVLRHHSADAAELFARHFERATLNAGAGRGQHPTQALLDALVLRREGLLERGRHVAIVGDIKHSRVMRSDVQLFLRRGINVTLVAPPTLMPDGWDALGAGFWAADEQGYGRLAWETELDRVLPQVDAIIMLRMQRERMEQAHITSLDEFSKLYGLYGSRLKMLRPGSVIMHPGPVNRGVEVSEETFRDSRSRINQQVTAGVAVRCALLCWACGRIPAGYNGGRL
jgi:aspartate carbamoyltransferase catalytic subunit